MPLPVVGTAGASSRPGFVKLTGFTPKTRLIADGCFTQFQWLSLMADVDATLGQQVLDLPQRQREANIHHHSEPDDLG